MALIQFAPCRYRRDKRCHRRRVCEISQEARSVRFSLRGAVGVLSALCRRPACLQIVGGRRSPKNAGISSGEVRLSRSLARALFLHSAQGEYEASWTAVVLRRLAASVPTPS